MFEHLMGKPPPIPPDHDAMEHITRAVTCVLAWKHPAVLPTRNSIEYLKIICEAFACAATITELVRSELESR